MPDTWYKVANAHHGVLHRAFKDNITMRPTAYWTTGFSMNGNLLVLLVDLNQIDIIERLGVVDKIVEFGHVGHQLLRHILCVESSGSALNDLGYEHIIRWQALFSQQARRLSSFWCEA